VPVIYDAIVVGAGPAGSIAAYELARAGLDVILLDAARFPRRKACGGAIPPRPGAGAGVDIGACAEGVLRTVRVTCGGQGETRLDSGEPIAYLVCRERFDHVLIERARGAGARVAERTRVLGVEEGERTVTVRTTSGVIAGWFLVGADGANSVVARSLGLFRRVPAMVSLSTEVAAADLRGAVVDEAAYVDLGVIPYGYGWAFRRGEVASVGVAGRALPRQDVRSPLGRLVGRFGLSGDAIAHAVRGHMIPLYAGPGRRLSTRRSVLVGDAGGLVEGFLGEGIDYAMRSGALAAHVIAEAERIGRGNVHVYDELVRREFGPAFRTGANVAKLVYPAPHVAVEALGAAPSLLEDFLDVLRGRRDGPGFALEAAWALARFLTGRVPREGMAATATRTDSTSFKGR
jgi:geranylgeranyl reductase family protein